MDQDKDEKKQDPEVEKKTDGPLKKSHDTKIINDGLHKTHPHEKPKEEKKQPSNNMMYIVSAVVLIGVVAMLIFFSMNPQTNPDLEKEGEDVEGDNEQLYKELLEQPGSILLIESLEKQKTIPQDYLFDYVETDSVNLDYEIVLRSEEDQGKAMIKTEYFEKTFYYSENQSIVCHKMLDQNELCAPIKNETTLATQAIETLPRFLNPQNKDVEIESTEKMIIFKGIEYVQDPKISEVAGRACNLIEYIVDYSRLNDNQLAELGLAPADPDQPYPKIHITRCLDDEFGFVLESTEEYELTTPGLDGTNTESVTYHMKAKEFVSRPDSGLEVPKVTTGEREVAALVEKSDKIFYEIANCKADAQNDMAHDLCVKNVAIELGDYKICEISEDDGQEDICISSYAVINTKPNLCKEAGTKEDECYTDIAYKTGDISYCSLSSSEEKRLECERLIEENLEDLPTQEMTPEDYCDMENVAQVRVCGEYMAVVSSLPGAGTSYYSDTEVFNCPLVAPEHVTDECKDAQEIECESTIDCDGDGEPVFQEIVDIQNNEENE